jgi:Ribbon-helix-helix protein, copG family
VAIGMFSVGYQSKSSLYNHDMKTVTIRLPEALAAQIEAEAHARKVTKSDVIRERPSAPSSTTIDPEPGFQAIEHLIGAVKGLPSDTSRNKKTHLKAGYGLNRPR